MKVGDKFIWLKANGAFDDTVIDKLYNWYCSLKGRTFNYFINRKIPAKL